MSNYIYINNDGDLQEDEFSSSSNGPEDAGKPVSLNGDGKIDSTMLPSTYTHIQNTPVSTWYVEHNLGKYPNVFVRDSSGSNELVFGTIKYLDINRIHIIFTNPFSGEAYLT